MLIEAIFNAFRVEPFYEPTVIDISYELRKIIPDYLDCVIVPTAATLKEDVITEDS